MVEPLLSTFITEHRLPDQFISTAQKWYLPLAKQIALNQIGANGVFFVGINGCQGSGKSTLASFLAKTLEQEYQLSVTVLSLDDFYYSQAKRQILSEKIHPLFKTRGVPGTHDVELLKKVLNKLQNSTLPLLLPRFNKATDNPYAKSEWEKINSRVDIVLMEGWCWGVAAQLEADITTPVNELESNEDVHSTWRNYVNTQLREYYEPLYSIMNFWIMLKAPSFDSVYQWRLQQEQKLATKPKQQSNGTQGIMNATQILQFIQYFQRLTEHGLKSLPKNCDVIFQLEEDRHISKARGLINVSQ